MDLMRLSCILSSSHCCVITQNSVFITSCHLVCRINLLINFLVACHQLLAINDVCNSECPLQTEVSVTVANFQSCSLFIPVYDHAQSDCTESQPQEICMEFFENLH